MNNGMLCFDVNHKLSDNLFKFKLLRNYDVRKPPQLFIEELIKFWISQQLLLMVKNTEQIVWHT